jgi:hypothetical protein
MMSSPGLTGRSSKHPPGVLDCPVKPGDDPDGVGVIGKRANHGGAPHPCGEIEPGELLVFTRREA